MPSLEPSRPTVDETVQIAVRNKLEELQDMVTEHLTVPWPQRSGMGPSEFVGGEAEVIAGVLQIWFGERDAPLFPVVRVELR